MALAARQPDTVAAVEQSKAHNERKGYSISPATGVISSRSPASWAAVKQQQAAIERIENELVLACCVPLCLSWWPTACHLPAMPVPALHFRVSHRCLARPQAFTKSASRVDATVNLASVRPLAAISSTVRRMRVASGCAASQV